MREEIRKLLEEEVVTATETNDTNIRKKLRRGEVQGVKKGKTWLLDRRDFPGKNRTKKRASVK